MLILNTEIDYHFFYEKVANGTLVTKYIPVAEQLADLFTTTLSKSASTFLRNKLGVQDYYSLLDRELIEKQRKQRISVSHH